MNTFNLVHSQNWTILLLGKEFGNYLIITADFVQPELLLRAGHHGVELLVVDLAVAVDVGLLDHGLDLLHGQLLAEVHHDDGELLPVDVAVAVLGKRLCSLWWFTLELVEIFYAQLEFV